MVEQMMKVIWNYYVSIAIIRSIWDIQNMENSTDGP